jgi:hypothetical protein
MKKLKVLVVGWSCKEDVKLGGLKNISTWKIFFNSKGKLKYSWDNKHRNGIKVLARITKFYVPKGTRAQQEGFVESCVIEGD